MPWSIYDGGGQRKYLTRLETDRFLAAARTQPAIIYGFCWFITATGCRISEALAMTPANFDFEAQQVVIESLKKREKRVFRAIPLPAKFLDWLKKGLSQGAFDAGRLWPWSRMTAYRRIIEVMEAAKIPGGCATPKGLRHAFGVRAIQSGVPLNMVQRWLGHADMKTTAIYTSATGPEERAIAARTWLDQDARYEPGPTRPPHPSTPRHYGPIATPKANEELQELCEQIKQSIKSDEIRARIPAHELESACEVLQFWLFCNTVFRENSFI